MVVCGAGPMDTHDNQSYQKVPDLNPCWESMVESRKVILVLFVGNNIIGSISNSPDNKQYLFHLIVKSRPNLV